MNIDAPLTSIDPVDRRIIKAIQAGLPLVTEPYAAVAAEVGTTVDDVMRRLRRMLENGVIRRIGAVPNHYRLGFKGNGMSVWDVPDAAVAEVGPRIGALDFVSHCYHRPRHPPTWTYNLFAMVHGRDRDEVADKVAAIAELLAGISRRHDVLFSTRILKKTGLRLIG